MKMNLKKLAVVAVGTIAAIALTVAPLVVKILGKASLPLMAFISFAFVPLTMNVVSILGEARLFPFGRNSALALFPGDALCLGAIFSLVKNQGANQSPYEGLIWLASSIAGVITFFVLRRREADYYGRGMYSPTKLWHDFYGYACFTTLITGLVLVELCSRHLPPPMALMCLSLYGLCNVLDGKRFEPKHVAPVRHPDKWRSLPEQIRMYGWQKTIAIMVCAFRIANKVDGRKSPE